MIKVLFVCLGNICRSPTAHGVFEHLVKEQGLDHQISVDSAGTSNWHIGNPPDPRSIKTALDFGIDLSEQSARQVCANDFQEFDYILAMDKENLSYSSSMAPDDFKGELSLFLPYAADIKRSEVPDPYYQNGDGFKDVVNLVTEASQALITHILHQHKL